MHQSVVTLHCQDGPGIVHAITGGIVEASGNITEMQQFSSPDSGRFFTRIHVQGSGVPELQDALADAVTPFDAEFAVHDATRPVKTLILASKAGHCVNDLLYRTRSGELPLDVVSVMANHDVLASMASFYGVRFEHHRVTPTPNRHLRVPFGR